MRAVKLDEYLLIMNISLIFELSVLSRHGLIRDDMKWSGLTKWVSSGLTWVILAENELIFHGCKPLEQRQTLV